MAKRQISRLHTSNSVSENADQRRLHTGMSAVLGSEYRHERADIRR